MTDEQRIALLEAELAEARADLRRVNETLRVMCETQAWERATEAERKAVRSARNIRARAKASTETSQETRTETPHPPTPSPSPPLPFSLPPPSTPSPSILYPFSPASPPPSPEQHTASSAAADLQVPLMQVAPGPAEQPADLQALWNAEAHPSLPRWQGMSEARKRRAAARLRERPLQSWRDVIRRLSASPFCRGEEGGTGWRASPDWLLQPETAERVLEGKYDRSGKPVAPPRPEVAVGRGGAQVECAGCGVECECAGAGQGVLLGYACRCMGAWMDSGLDYAAAPEWARNRRAGRAA